MDFALNNLLWLICHKPNQTKNLILNCYSKNDTPLNFFYFFILNLLVTVDIYIF